ncbi:hypothetical protein TCAL_15520, partial [Tigriopus californicus]
MDAVQGYFQIALTDAASKLTTFLLPWGKLRYLHGPMGLCSTNDIWCLLSDYVISGFPWAKKIVVDILVWASTLEELYDRIKRILFKPLLGVLKTRLPDISNTRLVKYQEIFSSYSFTVDWNAGKDHLIADALSRAPLFPADSTENELHLPLDCDIVSYRTTSDPAITFLFSQAKLDYDYQALSPSHAARVYRNIWDELSLIDDGNEGYLLTWGDRIVIPHPARNKILARLHFSYQGLTKTSLAAKSSYYWPGINNDLKTLIASCTACQKYQASQSSEPLQSYTLDQTFPTQLMAAELFDLTGINFLAIVDTYSGFLIQSLRLRMLRCFFLNVKNPTPTFPLRCTNFGASLALIALVQISFFGRQPRGLLPTLVPQDVPLDPTLLQNRNLAKIKKNQQTDESARILTPLLPGTAVLVQHPVSKIWGQTSIVLHPLDNGRCYESECSISGKRFR